MAWAYEFPQNLQDGYFSAKTRKNDSILLRTDGKAIKLRQTRAAWKPLVWFFCVFAGKYPCYIGGNP